MTEQNDLADVSQPTLSCPKCGGTMQKIPVEQYQVDRCDRCKGLFFDAFAHERLMELRGAETIDTGAKHEENRGEVVRINCPACHTPMIRMVDHHHPHVWYESCPVCFGIYLDAGEFREQKARSLVSAVRDMFHHTERR